MINVLDCHAGHSQATHSSLRVGSKETTIVNGIVGNVIKGCSPLKYVYETPSGRACLRSSRPTSIFHCCPAAIICERVGGADTKAPEWDHNRVTKTTRRMATSSVGRRSHSVLLDMFATSKSACHPKAAAPWSREHYDSMTCYILPHHFKL